MVRLKGASLGEALALLAIIRLGWKGLPRTNTLANCNHLQVTAVQNVKLVGTKRVAPKLKKKFYKNGRKVN